jgi:hypothetical protein
MFRKDDNSYFEENGLVRQGEEAGGQIRRLWKNQGYK